MQHSNQTDPTNDYPTVFLERIHSDPTCDWCKHPEYSLYRAGLCRHCYNISREVCTLESKALERKHRKQSIAFHFDFRLKTAKKMVDLAKMEGAKYADIDRK